MAIEWLAGNRLRGTTTERPSASLQSPSVGGWVEVGRTTLGSAGDTISVSSLSDKRYYMILGNIKNTGGDTVSHIRANSDSSGNYALRRSVNGGADSTTTSDNRLFSTHNSKSVDSRFIHGNITNLSAKEKLGIFNVVENGSTGVGTAPSRIEGVGKHAQTSNPVNELRLFNDEAGSFDTGGELVVLGWDPADTHTTNFWEELADVSYSSGSTIDTSTFSAKKYLWIQAISEGTSGNYLRVNGDTGSNYSGRYSNNGGSDGIWGTATGLTDNFGFDSLPMFWNFFIINNSANEKLAIGHIVAQSTAGAGNAPNRQENVSKWVTTGSQITSVQITGSGLSGGQIKVWGAD